MKNKDRYRIVEVIQEIETLAGKERITNYILQKRERILWIGPKVWKSYREVIDEYWNNYSGWFLSTTFCHKFKTLDSAKEQLKEEILSGTSAKLIEANVVFSI